MKKKFKKKEMKSTRFMSSVFFIINFFLFIDENRKTKKSVDFLTVLKSVLKIQYTCVESYFLNKKYKCF